jgi:undecaprenyl-diphosphatase
MNPHYQIMYFFSNMHNPVRNTIAQALTILGEEYVLIAVAMIFYWCIDKKRGFAAFFSMLVAMNLMNIVKVIVKFPRPWTVLKDLDVVRKETATGYSFPSGHATLCSSFYGSLAMTFKAKHVKIICSALVIIISLLRVYLCAHWPIDVIFGIGLGLTCAYIFSRFAMAFQENIDRKAKQMGIAAVVMLVAGLIVAILCQTEQIDAAMNQDLYVGLSISGACLLFSTIEQATIAFTVDGTTVQKILRYVVGMAGILILLIGLKKILPSTAIFRYIRYVVTGIWAVWLYPILGKKIKLFN